MCVYILSFESYTYTLDWGGAFESSTLYNTQNCLPPWKQPFALLNISIYIYLYISAYTYHLYLYSIIHTFLFCEIPVFSCEQGIPAVASPSVYPISFAHSSQPHLSSRHSHAETFLLEIPFLHFIGPSETSPTQIHRASQEKHTCYTPISTKYFLKPVTKYNFMTLLYARHVGWPCWCFVYLDAFAVKTNNNL